MSIKIVSLNEATHGSHDFIPDYDQHPCAECGRLCDCGCMVNYVIPDEAYPTIVDECLACSSCVDSLRARVTEERAERSALEMRVF